MALLVLIGIYGFWNTVAGQAGIFMPRVYETAGLHSAVQQDLLQVLVEQTLGEQPALHKRVLGQQRDLRHLGRRDQALHADGK